MIMRRMAVLLLTLAIVIPACADDLDRLRTMLARSDFEGILHEPMPATAEGRAIRVWALYGSLAAKRGEAEVAAMERDLPDDPWTLARPRRQYDKSLEVWREAAALTPAVRIHAGLWESIAAQRDMTPEQKSAAIQKDVDALLAARGSWPEVRLAAAREYRELKLVDRAKELAEASLRDTPRPPEARVALSSRWCAFSTGSGSGAQPPAV